MFQLNKSMFLLLLFLVFDIIIVRCEIEYNTINEDGSFSFRHTNDDIGGFYHSASGTPDNVVRGRYGSRNPATGQVDEIVYTAGPRGYRVNGPKIHRKTDLAQFPVPPRGSSDDPLADPFDTPAYSFKFRTPDQTRTEENDETGRVRGLYSYIDDIGERHSVRYAAGAGIGFQVSNAIADTPAAVGYAAPLYKAHPQTRGKTAVQRGPNGSYKLIAAGPDHRRAESRGSDGLVRGTYSYLDDKGVQRTVEYIAGAGIGYRVVQNSVGPGTHVNPSVSDFRLNDANFKLANDFGRGAGADSGFVAGPGGGSDRPNGSGGDGEYLKIASSGSISSSDDSDGGDDDEGNANLRSGGVGSDKGVGGGGLGVVAAAMGKTGSKVNLKNDRMGAAAASVSRGNTRFDGGGNAGNEDSYDAGADRNSASEGGSVSAKLGGRGGNRPSSNRNTLAADRAANRDRARNRNRDRFSGTASTGGSKTRQDGGYNYRPSSSSSNNNYNLNDDDVGGSLPPLITANRKILEMERRRDWIDRQRDSTIIQNVGKWYIGLPPGQSVRAHVQNIDLLPLGSRHVPSPAEALRQDEIADMVASLESGSGLMRSPAFRSS